jgi:uncharacterized protein YoxC
MELLAQDDAMEIIQEIIHRVGTTGEAGDHSFFVEEYDPTLPSQIPLGTRSSPLEESRIKQLISVLFRGINQKLSVAFLFIAISIVTIAVFSYTQLGAFRQNVYESTDVMQHLQSAVGQIQNSMLEEMLAVEQIHRGDIRTGLFNIRQAQQRDKEATIFLKTIASTNTPEFDSLMILQTRFRELANNMATILERLERRNSESIHSDNTALAQSHNLVMTSLHTLQLASMKQLALLENRVNTLLYEQRIQSDGDLQRVRFLLAAVAALVLVITASLWILAEKKVSRPIMQVFQESQIIDTERI